MALSGRTNPMIKQLKSRLRDESGGAIVLAILVSMVVLGAGAVALTVSRTDMKVTANHNRGVMATRRVSSSGPWVSKTT